MTRFLLGALVAVVLVTAAESYVLIGIVQRLRTTFEQLLAAAQQLLAAVPGKSAEPTEAPADAQPRIWFRALTQRFVDVLEHVVGDTELARWEDDGGTTGKPDDTPAATGPATEPMERIDLAGGLRVPSTPTDTADDVDRILARFTYTEGHRR